MGIVPVGVVEEGGFEALLEKKSNPAPPTAATPTTVAPPISKPRREMRAFPGRPGACAGAAGPLGVTVGGVTALARACLPGAPVGGAAGPGESPRGVVGYAASGCEKDNPSSGPLVGRPGPFGCTIPLVTMAWAISAAD